MSSAESFHSPVIRAGLNIESLLDGELILRDVSTDDSNRLPDVDLSRWVSQKAVIEVDHEGVATLVVRIPCRGGITSKIEPSRIPDREPEPTCERCGSALIRVTDTRMATGESSELWCKSCRAVRGGDR